MVLPSGYPGTFSSCGWKGQELTHSVDPVGESPAFSSGTKLRCRDCFLPNGWRGFVLSYGSQHRFRTRHHLGLAGELAEPAFTVFSIEVPRRQHRLVQPLDQDLTLSTARPAGGEQAVGLEPLAECMGTGRQSGRERRGGRCICPQHGQNGQTQAGNLLSLPLYFGGKPGSGRGQYLPR